MICELAGKQYLCTVMNVNAILTALLIPFAGTALGSAFVFFMKKEIPGWLQKALMMVLDVVLG